MEPKITVITVTYNCDKLLLKTIRSIAVQEYDNLEYIIIDGNSTDKTLDIIKDNLKDISFWISENDSGIYDAMNKGIRFSSGEWIIFMNAGDTFSHQNVLKNIFQDTQLIEYDVVYGDVILQYSNYSYIKRALPLTKMDHKLSFCHQSSFVRRSVISEYMFNTKYKLAADYDLFFRLYKDSYKFLYVNTPISIFESESGAANNNERRVHEEYYEINSRDRTILGLLFKHCLFTYITFKGNNKTCVNYLRYLINRIRCIF